MVRAIRLACRFGWRAVTIFTHSTAAGYQAVDLRAQTWLKRTMWVLWALVWRLAVSGMVVRFVWVPSALQAADRLSRLFSDHNGNKGATEFEVWCIYERLVLPRSLLCLRGAACLTREAPCGSRV